MLSLRLDLRKNNTVVLALVGSHYYSPCENNNCFRYENVVRFIIKQGTGNYSQSRTRDDFENNPDWLVELWDIPENKMVYNFQLFYHHKKIGACVESSGLVSTDEYFNKHIFICSEKVPKDIYKLIESAQMVSELAR